MKKQISNVVFFQNGQITNEQEQAVTGGTLRHNDLNKLETLDWKKKDLKFFVRINCKYRENNLPAKSSTTSLQFQRGSEAGSMPKDGWNIGLDKYRF